jgi:hypothetical protein
MGRNNLSKISQKIFQKPIDKQTKVCYNIDTIKKGNDKYDEILD